MPSDGAFCYILKRLSDAERDNDKIYGVIRGVHVSSAGPAEGIFVLYF
jgi:acyl transferase domain-containing protein